MDADANQWPRVTREVMLRIRTWFQDRGYRDPADLILAFVTVQELMRRKGGPVVLATEAAALERLAREVYGNGVVLYWAPECSEESAYSVSPCNYIHFTNRKNLIKLNILESAGTGKLSPYETARIWPL